MATTEELYDRLGEEIRDPAAIQAKFDAATQAQFDRQRTNLKSTEQQWYNKLFNTQLTAMDTIRKSNAEAVASGANRGVQAANELAAILGLQSEAVGGSTEIANEAIGLAQDETTAMLENIIKAQEEADKYNLQVEELLTNRANVEAIQQQADAATAQTRNETQRLIADMLNSKDPQTRAIAQRMQQDLDNTGVADRATATQAIQEEVNEQFKGGDSEKTVAQGSLTRYEGTPMIYDNGAWRAYNDSDAVSAVRTAGKNPTGAVLSPAVSTSGDYSADYSGLGADITGKLDAKGRAYLNALFDAVAKDTTGKLNGQTVILNYGGLRAGSGGHPLAMIQNGKVVLLDTLHNLGTAALLALRGGVKDTSAYFTPTGYKILNDLTVKKGKE